MSIAEQIREATLGLNYLAGYVPPSAWDQIRAIRSDLSHAAEQAERLEREWMIADHYGVKDCNWLECAE